MPGWLAGRCRMDLNRENVSNCQFQLPSEMGPDQKKLLIELSREGPSNLSPRWAALTESRAPILPTLTHASRFLTWVFAGSEPEGFPNSVHPSVTKQCSAEFAHRVTAPAPGLLKSAISNHSYFKFPSVWKFLLEVRGACGSWETWRGRLRSAWCWPASRRSPSP